MTFRIAPDRGRARRLVWSLALGAMFPAGPLAAQELRVYLMEPGAQPKPSPGALISLLAADGTVVIAAVTNDFGRARLSARPGGYQVRVERPGFVDTLVAVTIDSTIDSMTVTAPSRRPVLPAQLVPLPPSCPTGGVPPPLTSAWAEAKKTVTVVATGEAVDAVSLSITTFDRSLSPSLKRESEEAATILAPGNRAPNTKESAEREGYLVRAGGDSLAWFAPQVGSFGSVEFERAHCFGWVSGTGEREGMLGLTFTPVGGHPGALAGGFWFDPLARQLRVIDYRFEGVPVEWKPDRFGGSLEIHRSDQGFWITRFWYQRTPRLKLAQGSGKDRLLGFQESGAEVTAIEPTVDTTDRIATARAIASRAAQTRSRTARIAGSVVDSAGTPVPDVEVAVLGAEIETKSNERGNFVLSGSPLGLQIVRARKIGFKVQYIPLRLAAGQEWEGRILLPRMPVVLGEIVVVGKYGKPAQYANTAKYDGFYRRRASKAGKFLTREEINKVNSSRIADLVKSIPGIMTGFNPVTGRDGVEFTGCPVNVSIWVDGQRLSGEPAELLPLITSRDIEAIEVYQRDNLIPPEFQDGSCAAIVMWSR